MKKTILYAKDCQFILEYNESKKEIKWCVCYLKPADKQTIKLGAESLEIVTNRLLLALRRSQEEVSLKKQQLKPGYNILALALAEGHASIYVEYFEDSVLLDFKDKDMEQIFKLEISNSDKNKWIEEFEKLKAFAESK